MKQAGYQTANIETAVYKAVKTYADKRGMKIKSVIAEAVRTYLAVKSQEDKAA